MYDINIKKLEKLMLPYLEKNGKKLHSYTYKNLLPTGENYGSIMLALTIKVENQNNEEEIIECVGKAVPQTKVLWEFFDVSVTFKKETAIYNAVVPKLNNFGEGMGINNLMSNFAEHLASRLSLDPASNIVDSDAVIILKNMASQGYIVGDRLNGFNGDTTKLILKNLAVVHASIVAYKLREADEFNTKLLPYISQSVSLDISEDFMDDFVKYVLKIASRKSQCLPLLSRVEEGLRKLENIYKHCKVEEPFATFVHRDLWTNNIMVKFENGKPAHNIFVDFQVCQYGSPVWDVLFFLYTSVQIAIVKENIDELMKLYYHEFVETLKKLQCDTKPFSYEVFLEETNKIARDIAFSHIVIMLVPIFTKRGQAKGKGDWGLRNMLPYDEEILHENYYERLYFTINDFANRKWI